jgi:hypothetical protein
MYFPAQGLVVCTRYKHAVLPGHINAYLRDEKTHKMPKKDRQPITQEVQRLPGLVTDRLYLNQLASPPANSPAIPELQPARTDSI